MYKFYRNSQKTNFTYKWTIKDFESNYLNLFDVIDSDSQLKSSNLSSMNSDVSFYLNLSFRKFEEDWLYYSLHINGMKDGTILNCQLYTINNKNEKCEKREFTEIYEKQLYNREYRLHKEYCLKARLLENKEELLPNDTLTLLCDLTIHDKPEDITRVYERKFDNLISNQLMEFFESQTNADFTFYVDDQEFKVHKFMLMLRSPVFEAMFDNELTEKKDNCTRIADIQPEIFQMMLKFIYADKIDEDLTEDKAVKLLVAADKYDVKDLKTICMGFFHEIVKIENAVKIFLLAEDHHSEELWNYIKDFINNYKMKVFSTINIQYLREHPNLASIFLKKT